MGEKTQNKMLFLCQKYIRTLSKCDGEPQADLPKGLDEGLGELFLLQERERVPWC